ncbi:hypothetical protein AVEN_127023-1 [Araneus ventricosus]|uniref:Uncharacterized protein n=1 Tax=Araneus ventricosus TaxID=182803 RepID=A0A4Y2C1E6_ARAVE|nr:hypothetical protein AVEN_127023-1 [Araneus ventricosus]
MELQCTIAPDLFQCDHPSCGPHIAFCTQHSRRPKITCHQESQHSPQYVVLYGRQRRDNTKIDIGLQITPQEKVRCSVRLDPGGMDMENVVYRMQCVVHKKDGLIEGLSHSSTRK